MYATYDKRGFVAASQTDRNKNKKAIMLVYYMHTYPDAISRYHASDMQLYIASDAVYLVLPKARSRGTRHFYLSDKLKNMTSMPIPKPSGPALAKCKTLRNVISSAANVEVSTFHHHTVR